MFGPCIATSIGVGDPKLITWLTMSPASKENAQSGSASDSLWRSLSFNASPRSVAEGLSATSITASCGPLVNR